MCLLCNESAERNGEFSQCYMLYYTEVEFQDNLEEKQKFRNFSMCEVRGTAKEAYEYALGDDFSQRLTGDITIWLI